jgi:hypothetical protein
MNTNVLTPLDAVMRVLRAEGVAPIVTARMGNNPHYTVEWTHGRSHTLRVPIKAPPNRLHPSWYAWAYAQRVRWLLKGDRAVVQRRWERAYQSLRRAALR